MTDFQCPHCGQTGASGAEIESGAIGECAQCGRSFAFPRRLRRPAAAAQHADEPLADADSWTSAPTDVSLTRSGPLAAAGTGLFYLAVVWPLQGTYFGDLFGARGWVPYAIALLSFWAIVILVLKFRRYREQMAVLGLDLLPANLGERIDPHNAHVFETYLKHVAATMPRSFLVQRLIWAVRHLRMRSSISELAQQLSERTRADADAIDSSYSMLRVFIWAIPILGFIGTVLGIGTSVAAFSDTVSSAADLEVMKNSIGSVTTGLGVAFDTTLLALVMSILIMFPTSSLEKAEEDFLALSEDYCDAHLLCRLAASTQQARDAAVASGGQTTEPTHPEHEAELASALEMLEERIARLEPAAKD
jgi:biopolymer transport protein ExbB/TolQ